MRAPRRLCVWLSGVRWAIEPCFEETNTELGMDHYEVRKYPGWHHHMLTCMLAHFCLWHLHSRLEKQSTSAYGLASPEVIGSRVAAQSLAGGCGLAAGGGHATAPSPRLSRAQEKAPARDTSLSSVVGLTYRFLLIK